MSGAHAEAHWRHEKERSHPAIIRLMVWISLRFGRSLSRVVLHGIALYFTAFAPRARMATRSYLERALGRRPTLADHYRHILCFASTIHDRVYLLNGGSDRFSIEVIGSDLLQAATASGQGALLIGAHLGSFEVLRAAGKDGGGFRVAMLMYEDNARKLNSTLAAINPAATADVIPLGQIDSMLLAHDRLEAGCLVGMLADRGLGDDTTRESDFLGAPAPFPLGPFRVAAMLKRPVFFMTGLYLGGNRYRIHFEPLGDFSQLPRAARDAEINAVIDRYAALLTRHCRQAPYNWFNFFDFWQRR